MLGERKRAILPKAAVPVPHDYFEDLGVVIAPYTLVRPIEAKLQALVFAHRWPTLAKCCRANCKILITEL
jgi:hypothetical protein